mmetsp:Transcript_5733/g.7328  ORF Transcript_5733/g.7328 Transcript_5733/m.7328 type:complete len:174 (-) Transcript_5733:79-600(-)
MMTKLLSWLPALVGFLMITYSEAFSQSLHTSATVSHLSRPMIVSTNKLPTINTKRSPLYLSSSSPTEDDDGEEDDMKDKPSVVQSKAIDNASAEPDVPLNLPSPVLLSASMVIAIASTGSLFEFTGGNGSIINLGVAVVGIPSCLFLIYAAIIKGIAETEADDAEYKRKMNRF